MPEPSEYLRANQKDGKPLGADTLFIETWRWLKERTCDQFISPRLMEAYAQAFTRYIQCEEAISAYVSLSSPALLLKSLSSLLPRACAS